MIENDIDIVVGIVDETAAGLDRIADRVDRITRQSQAAIGNLASPISASLDRFADIAQRQAEQRQGSMAGGLAARSESILRSSSNAIEATAVKAQQAVESIGTNVSGVTRSVAGGLRSVSEFVRQSAGVAAVGLAFGSVAVRAGGAAASIGLLPQSLQRLVQVGQQAEQQQQSFLNRVTMYAGAASSVRSLSTQMGVLADSSASATSKVLAIAKGAIAAKAVQTSLELANRPAKSLGEQIFVVVQKGLALATVANTVRQVAQEVTGLNLLAKTTAGLLGSAVTTTTNAASKGVAGVRSMVGAGVAKIGSIGDSLEAALPKGLGFFTAMSDKASEFAAKIGGVPGLLLAVPAAAAAAAIGIATLVTKTDAQLAKLSNKMQLIEAAKLNVRISEIDSAPFDAISQKVYSAAKALQSVTGENASRYVQLGIDTLPKGLNPDQLIEATKAAAGLGEVFGGGLADGMYRTRAALDGNFEGFEKLIPGISTWNDRTRQLAAVSLLAANGLTVLQRENTTFFGAINQARLGIGNLLEDLGRFQDLPSVVGGLIRDVVQPIADMGEAKLGNLLGIDSAEIVAQAKRFGAGTVAVLGTVKENWRDMVGFAIDEGRRLWLTWDKMIVNFAKTWIPWLGKQFVSMVNTSIDNVVRGFATAPIAQKMSAGVLRSIGRNDAADQIEKNAEKIQRLSQKEFKVELPIKVESIDAQIAKIDQRQAERVERISDTFESKLREAADGIDSILDEGIAALDVDLSKNDKFVPAKAAKELDDGFKVDRFDRGFRAVNKAEESSTLTTRRDDPETDRIVQANRDQHEIEVKKLEALLKQLEELNKTGIDQVAIAQAQRDADAQRDTVNIRVRR